jgi:hypothetical protein
VRQLPVPVAVPPSSMKLPLYAIKNPEKLVLTVASEGVPLMRMAFGSGSSGVEGLEQLTQLVPLWAKNC